MFQSLPPILCVYFRDSVSSCSKAPWGLSVQSRVTCIFTGISISPGPSLRQCPNHYTFRAGRNLPDKEFRYLRTGQASAPIRQLSLSQAPVFLVNSCLGLFSAALSGSKCLTFRLLRAILLPKLRMQFAEFLNEGFPAHLRILSPPTCVGLRYGRISPR